MKLLETWNDRFRKFFQGQTLLNRRLVESFIRSELDIKASEVFEICQLRQTERLNKMVEANTNHCLEVIKSYQDPLTKDGLIEAIRKCLL